MVGLRGVLPAVFSIAMGALVGAVQRGDDLTAPLAFTAVVFVLLQILSPIQQAVSAKLGDRTTIWLDDRLTEACVRLPGALQDFYRFEVQARQTVGLGDVPRLDDEPAVVAAVSRAGADDVVARLYGGLATQLGPTWPGGVEVSFGQWQKLALARGFMRDDPLLLVLDEPTAALGAETEQALFERYAAAARSGRGSESAPGTDGRITILVSHRFSTVRMADLIVVLDGSHVVEVGSHAELLANRGRYAELYGIQAAAYR